MSDILMLWTIRILGALCLIVVIMANIAIWIEK